MRLGRPVQEILASLDDRRPLVGRAEWERNTVARLTAIASCGEAAAVTHIGRFLRSPSDAVVRAAARAIHALLWGIAPEALAELDREARVEWLTRDELVVGDVARLAALGEAAPGLAAFASLHRSGYVRAEGVAALRTVDEAPAVGYLLLRANDWVEAVRLLALAAVRERLLPANAATFLRHGPLLVARALEGRAKGDGLCDEVARLLARPECREAVAQALHDGSARARRAAQWLVNRASREDEGLAELALGSDDAGLRLGALLHTVPGLPAPTRRALLRRSLGDPLSGIRSLALEGWLREDPDPAERAEVLHSFLLDASPSLREHARWHLGWRDGAAAAAWYRARLAAGALATGALAAALAGLGETGTQADAPLVEAHLSDGRPRVVRAALRAWARVDADRASERLVAFLGSSSPSVARAASELLRRRRPVPGLEEIRRLAREGASVAVRRRALAFLVELPPWSVLADVLAAADPDEPAIATWTASNLDGVVRRLNAGRSSPTGDEFLRARAAFLRVRPHLQATTAADLDFVFRTTRIA